MSLKFGVQIRMSDDLKDLAKQFPKAAQAVLNRGTMQAQKIVAKEVSQENNIGEKYIRKRIVIKKSTMQSLVAILRFSQRGFNPYLFLKSKEPTTRREPVLLEVKRGSTTFVGNKFFTNIGRKSGLLKVMRQPGESRDQLTQMPYLKANQIFNMTKIETTVREFVVPYMTKELPRVIEAWFKSGRAIQ